MSVQNTHAGAAAIAAVLSGAKRLWFIGIGGVHMASLALFAARRFSVAGSDTREGEGTARLREAGIPVTIGHNAAAACAADAVIFTLAISPEDEEYLAAERAGVPRFSRADFLGYLMADFPCRIGVAGSHGKSTVTAMLAEILLFAGRSPTVFCGAPVRALGSPFAAGTGREVLFEACEYEDSFLCFTPTLAVLLNAEMDHVDYFADESAIERSFAAFGALPGAEGILLYSADDAGAVRCAAGSPARRVSFGRSGDYRIADVTLPGGYGAFSLCLPGGGALALSLRVPGAHNVQNAAAAAATADLLGVPHPVISAALGAFRGAARRLEFRGVYFGARFYDDYAHHPTEIRAALQAARALLGCGGRLYCVFQPHTYSRTAAFFAEFCVALRLADRVIVTGIYPARETDTLGMSGALLAAGVGDGAAYAGSFHAAAELLRQELSPLDMVVVMGAGDINRLFAEFGERGFTSGAESDKIEEVKKKGEGV